MSGAPARSTKAKGPTPMMAQYLGLKAQHPDAVLLFRMGDFYETFHDDAELVARLLGLTLTSRDKQGDEPIPLAGLPYHALDQYLARLLDAGVTVAICEQVEDPASAKGLVRREVVEVISPGTITNPSLLRDADGVFLLAVNANASAPLWGWALLEGSTGEFRCGSAPEEEVLALPRRFGVREVVVPQGRDAAEAWAKRLGVKQVTPVGDLLFRANVASEELCEHFGVHALGGLGLDATEPAVGAAGAALRYLHDRQRTRPSQVLTLVVERADDRLHLDRETVAHLELFEGVRAGERETSLFHHLDRTRTALGRRRLADWLRAPLSSVEAIDVRLDAVQWFVEHASALQQVRDALKGMGDLERVAGRIATARVLPSELAALRDGLTRVPRLVQAFGGHELPTALADLRVHAPELQAVARPLASKLVERPPTHMRNGGVFAEGVDAELDRLRGLDRGGKVWIARYQETERERTGIANLKVGYNKVFGYHLEVTNKHLDRVPEGYVEKQRLTSGKRFVTEELRAREAEILGAEQARVDRESVLFTELVASLAPRLRELHRGFDVLARVDALASLAWLACERNYTRPLVDDSLVLEIEGGRHAVVEELGDEPFVPNDLRLDPRDRQIVLLTGPNMGGKSTYLRQAALLVVMAQMGSFVPARHARIGRVDRLFTRVGASDNLARGQSTFLVEMTETARILRGATERSLVIFDEVGRGTSTRDGMVLAQAITEFLHDGPVRPRTLFATHFHELTALASRHARIANARLEVKEWEGQILFLHRVVPGPSDRSYGIHVAELAGVPGAVLERARELLERSEPAWVAAPELPPPVRSRTQLPLFQPAPVSEHSLVARLRSVDPESLRPVDALVLLAELVAAARRG